MQPLMSDVMAERKPINIPQTPKRRSLDASRASSADNVVYPPSHQYHYIQYYQQPINQYANPQMLTCQCTCSCGNQDQQQQQQQNHNAALAQRLIPQHSHQHSSLDSQRVAVIVHRQASGSASSNELANNTNAEALPAKCQSETSLLNHSYQALKMSESLSDNLFNASSASKIKAASSCDCDLECTCPKPINRKPHNNNKQFQLSEAMLTADEITVSESDNNSSTVRRCERNQIKKMKSNCLSDASDGITVKNHGNDGNYNNTNHIDIYSDGDADEATETCLKEKYAIAGDVTDLRPPLPPRPPPRPQTSAMSSNGSNQRHSSGVKKYVIWCLLCGGFSCLLGLLFLGVYFLLHSYTITVGNFETVPTFVPATLLILTGLCIMTLARRRNRYSYLIKLSGVCGLVSALTCALVTVTTTVLHMSRLQALRECEYAQKTRTCTCYSDVVDSQVDRVDKGVRLVFDSLSDCGVVHGSLYSCLRAIFGLSVAGVLVAAFSCMLVYQLLSHERKKMYWEQLELRCRSLYTRPQMPAQCMSTTSGTIGCRCCEQCHAHRQAPLQGNTYPWDGNSEPRFWSTQPPGNFYSPNPGGEDLAALTGACRNHEMPSSRSRGTGWSWNRWWQRSLPDANNTRFRQTPSSPDSQYGFTNNTSIPIQTINDETPTPANQSTSHFNILPGNLPYGVWGPPPPYSDPNSPARRGYYQYIQSPYPMNLNIMSNPNGLLNAGPNENQSHSMCVEQANATSNCFPQAAIGRAVAATIANSNSNYKSKGDYENTPSDSDCGSTMRERDRFSNTLPTRKVKKRLDPGSKSIGPNSQYTARVSVQQVFSNTPLSSNDDQRYMDRSSNDGKHCNSGQLNKCGVENTGFQTCTNDYSNSGQSSEERRQDASDPTESEVYFADVSSCCNMSVKNDHYYEETRASPNTIAMTSEPNSREAHHQHNRRHHHHHHHHHHQHHHHGHQDSNCSSTNNEDYLAQRFGQRENSIRSRLPFPQTTAQNDDFVENLKLLTPNNTNMSTIPNKPNANYIQQTVSKDNSRQSMCSVDSDVKTDFTDLSPSTPCTNASSKVTQIKDYDEENISDLVNQTINDAATPTNFVATYPYSSESQSQEAHKRSTKNLAEAHYEVIDDSSTHQTNVRLNASRTAGKALPCSISTLGKRLDGNHVDWKSEGMVEDRQRL